MALLKDWNWYLPKWLDRILPQVFFDPHHEHFSRDKELTSASNSTGLQRVKPVKQVKKRKDKSKSNKI